MQTRIGWALALSLVCARPAFATTQGKWFGGPATPNTGATRFVVPDGGLIVNATELNSAGIAPIAMTISKLKVLVITAPDTGVGTQSWAFTLRSSATDTLANTSLTCTISEASTTCTDASNSAAIAAGDRVSLQIVPSGTPTATTVIWQLEVSGTTEIGMIGSGDATTLSTASTQHLVLDGGGLATNTETQRRLVSPSAGTLGDLYIRLTTAPGVGTSRTFTVMQNGVATSLAVTFTDTANGVSSDTTVGHAITVAAGDYFTLRSTLTGVPVASTVQYGVGWTPTTTGEFWIATTDDTTVATGATNFLPAHAGGVVAPNATESTWPTLGDTDFQITACYAVASVAPANGAGTQTYTINLRENTADASTPFTITISEAATTGNASGTFTPASLGKLDYQIVPAATPAASRIHVSCRGYIAPAAVSGAGSLLLLGVGK